MRTSLVVVAFENSSYWIRKMKDSRRAIPIFCVLATAADLHVYKCWGAVLLRLLLPHHHGNRRGRERQLSELEIARVYHFCLARLETIEQYVMYSHWIYLWKRVKKKERRKMVRYKKCCQSTEFKIKYRWWRTFFCLGGKNEITKVIRFRFVFLFSM